MLRRLCLAAATLGSLVACQPAAASSLGLVEIRGPNGALIAADRGGPFSYPANGSLVKVGRSTVRNGAVVLDDVSLFGGDLHARRIVVPARGHAGAKVVGLDIAGTRYRSTANTAISLGADSYMVALQEAVAPGLSSGRVGVVGLRVHLGTQVAGLPKGTELWVGIAAAAAREPASGVTGVPAELIPLYSKARERYGVPWTVLAAINRFETGFGSNLDVSTAGAVGWMQFLPSTWKRYGLDGNGDGRRNPVRPGRRHPGRRPLPRGRGQRARPGRRRLLVQPLAVVRPRRPRHCVGLCRCHPEFPQWGPSTPHFSEAAR